MCPRPLLKRLKSNADFSIIWKCRFKQRLKSQSSPTSHGCLRLRSPISQNHGIFWLGNEPTTRIIKVQLQLGIQLLRISICLSPEPHSEVPPKDIVLDPSSKHWWQKDWEKRAEELIPAPATSLQPDDTMGSDTLAAGKAWSRCHSPGALGSRTNAPSRPPKNDHFSLQIRQ